VAVMRLVGQCPHGLLAAEPGRDAEAAAGPEHGPDDLDEFPGGHGGLAGQGQALHAHPERDVGVPDARERVARERPATGRRSESPAIGGDRKVKVAALARVANVTLPPSGRADSGSPTDPAGCLCRLGRGHRRTRRHRHGRTAGDAVLLVRYPGG
jgi:hypothetical protein